MLAAQNAEETALANQFSAAMAAKQLDRVPALIAQVTKLSGQIPAEIDAIVTAQTARANAEVAAAGRAYDTSKKLIMGVLGSVCCCLALAWLTSRSVTRPGQNTVEVLEQVAAGDLPSGSAPEARTSWPLWATP